jgi:hypothetical protein
MNTLFVNSGMIVTDSGLYFSLDESYKVFLNKGDKVPDKDSGFQILKLTK